MLWNALKLYKEERGSESKEAKQKHGYGGGGDDYRFLLIHSWRQNVRSPRCFLFIEGTFSASQSENSSSDSPMTRNWPCLEGKMHCERVCVCACVCVYVCPSPSTHTLLSFPSLLTSRSVFTAKNLTYKDLLCRDKANALQMASCLLTNASELCDGLVLHALTHKVIVLLGSRAVSHGWFLFEECEVELKSGLQKQ